MQVRDTKPILMSGPLVLSTIDGLKTETRRPVKIDIAEDQKIDGCHWVDEGWAIWHKSVVKDFCTCIPVKCPYGSPDTLLWVRETWRTYESLDHLKPIQIVPAAGVSYDAGGSNVLHHENKSLHGMGKTRVSILMPRWVSRLTLEVLEIGVERLQDITEEGAQAEGVAKYCGSYRLGFTQKWNEIYGAGSWQKNPWVWVIKYKTHMKNVDKLLEEIKNETKE